MNFYCYLFILGSNNHSTGRGRFQFSALNQFPKCNGFWGTIGRE